VSSRIYVGTAGWSIPRAQQARFPPGDSHLARYAQVFPAVEINSTFYRPHRATTFARWAACVPRAFRFSVKVPRTITHDQRLAHSAPLLEAFLEEVAPLGKRLGCLLVQLPPSLAFDARVAADPSLAQGGGEPGGWRGLAYFRLHGSPRIYYSSYDSAYLDALADQLRDMRRRRIPTWCVFDNTALGAAAHNGLSIAERLECTRKT